MLKIILTVPMIDIQRGQVAIYRSPEFCLKLTYRYLLKADHVPGNIWSGAILSPWA